jgi:hypothetical protein
MAEEPCCSYVPKHYVPPRVRVPHSAPVLRVI